jgi:signal transduction histidine kinase
MRQRPSAAGIKARAIEYTGLWALVGGTFLAVVMGLGAALGLAVPHAGLTMGAAVLLAVTFEPTRRQLRRLANRLVYGHRHSPWEAVSQLASQIGDGREPADLLRELADVVRSGTGASQVVVWLRDATAWSPAAASPGTAAPQPVPVGDDGLPQVNGAAFAAPIRHGQDLLGAVTVTKDSAGALTALERRLVTDLATQAGIVTRTLRLRQDLGRRLAISRRSQRELIASRARVVAAQDEHRRRLERDIHDSCQQPAVVLAGRLGLATALAHSQPAQAHAAITDAYTDLSRLAEALQRLTAATPMPELVTGGIAAALRAETASLPIPVEVDDRLARRLPSELEAAVYLCCTEAIQNAVKHTRASRLNVQLSAQHGWLTCQVRDDGTGFDPDRTSIGTGLGNMRERLRAFNGRLVIRSSQAGTEICAEVPLPADESEL